MTQDARFYEKVIPPFSKPFVRCTKDRPATGEALNHFLWYSEGSSIEMRLIRIEKWGLYWAMTYKGGGKSFSPTIKRLDSMTFAEWRTLVAQKMKEWNIRGDSAVTKEQR